MRFDMLKKPATAAMSTDIASVKPASRSALAVGLLDIARARPSVEIQHRCPAIKSRGA